jgi:predicted nuclease with TOPRIM domain
LNEIALRFAQRLDDAKQTGPEYEWDVASRNVLEEVLVEGNGRIGEIKARIQEIDGMKAALANQTKDLEGLKEKLKGKLSKQARADAESDIIQIETETLPLYKAKLEHSLAELEDIWNNTYDYFEDRLGSIYEQASYMSDLEREELLQLIKEWDMVSAQKEALFM